MRPKNAEYKQINDMRHLKSFLMMALMGMGITTQAQTDVTSLLANPSFEQDATSGLSQVTNPNDGLRGWTLTNPTGWN